MSDSSTAVPPAPRFTTPAPRPRLSDNPLNPDLLARRLRESAGSEQSIDRLKLQLARLVGREYGKFPVAEAQRYAEDAIRAAYPQAPPPTSNTYEYFGFALPGAHTGYDIERCQRLCASVLDTYKQLFGNAE